MPLGRDQRTLVVLAAFIVFNAVVVGLLVWCLALAAPIEEMYRRTAIANWMRIAAGNTPRSEWYDGFYLGHALKLQAGGDSWRELALARAYLSDPTTKAEPIYSALLVDEKAKFQYPLTSLIPFAALEDLARSLHLGRDKFLAAVGWLFVLLSIGATYELLRRRLPDDEHNLLLAGLISFAGLTYHPLMMGLVGGQTQVWINGIFALGLLAFATGFKASSGVLIGLACLLKPHYALFLVWGAIRREWRFSLACFIVVAAGSLVAIALYGWSQNLDYINGLRFLSQRGESQFLNQSPNGLLQRVYWLFDHEHKVGAGLPFPQYVPFIYYGTLLCSLALIGAALLFKAKDRVIDFCIMAVSIAIASPIAWMHHYGVLFPIYAVACGALRNRSWALVWLAVSFVLSSHYIEAITVLLRTPANFLVSYMLFGALILLVLLYLVSNASILFSRRQLPSLGFAKHR